MLEPRSLIRIWGPPSAVVDEVTGDVAINIGGRIIETVNRAYDARQTLEDEANPPPPRAPEQVVEVDAVLPPAEEPSKTSTLSKLLGKRDSKAPKADK